MGEIAWTAFGAASPQGSSAAPDASTLQLLGAGGFGVILGWYLFYVNRNRSGRPQLRDLITVVGVLGGGTVLTLFPEQTDLFGAYGIGLVVGFLGYFLLLLILVAVSEDFTFDWFLDGRRPARREGQMEGPPPMEQPGESGVQA